MSSKTNDQATILVMEDVEETRDGIERLLRRDGYRVEGARDEQGAAERARLQHPDLILVSLGGTPSDIIAAAARVRESAGLGEDVPVVIFCIQEIEEGDEIAIGHNVHIARPDNFDQLRGLLSRLLRGLQRVA